MSPSPRKTVLKLAILTTIASMATGCKFFDIGNPLLPQARLLGEAEPSMIEVTYDYKLSQSLRSAAASDATYRIFTYPNDGTPGVQLNAYSAEYFDMNGRSIPTLFLSKTNFGISKYVPPASTGSPSEVTMILPVYNQQVRLYGENLAYDLAGGVQLNRNFSHVITAAVTLYGQDDNFNQVEVRFNVPIKFTANISQ